MALIGIIILILLIMPKPRKRKDNNPCVYVVQTTYEGKPLFKIGYSKNFPVRLSYIKRSFKLHGLPEPTVVKVHYRKDAKEFEKAFHGENELKSCKTVPKTLTGYTEYYRVNLYK
jgi:hypothetical protein